MTNVDLDKAACKHFVCPNISYIDEAVVDLYNSLSGRSPHQPNPPGDPIKAAGNVSEVAKSIAVAFFKKTYHSPPYTRPKNVMLGCIYIASHYCNVPVNQDELSGSAGVATPTVRKHYRMVADAFDMNIISNPSKVWVDRWVGLGGSRKITDLDEMLEE